MIHTSICLLFATSLVAVAAFVHGEESKLGWTASPAVVAAAAKKNDSNFEEAKVPPYTLPDPLVNSNGTTVTRDTWSRRRAEILEAFREHVYGRNPVGRPKNMAFQVVENNPQDLDGRATRKLVEIAFDTPHAGRFSFRVQLYLPNDAQKPVPAIVLLSFQGLADPATEAIIARGMGLAILDRTQIAADDATTYRGGVINAFSGEGELAKDAWGTIAAWAWGASRVLDYLETDSDVDAKRICVAGHSRMGKTALWAGANDERFAITYSNNSGCCGAALSRRIFGETVAQINQRFPHWCCKNCQQYDGREDAMPVDQHELIALVAPRLVYVTSADEDLWADPRGEFLSCVHASPVFRLLGVEGISTSEMPPLDQPVAKGHIGYHIRRGKHKLLEYDWQRFIDFATLHKADIH